MWTKRQIELWRLRRRALDVDRSKQEWQAKTNRKAYRRLKRNKEKYAKWLEERRKYMQNRKKKARPIRRV